VAQKWCLQLCDYSRSVNVSHGTHGSSLGVRSLVLGFRVGSVWIQESEAHLDEFADMRIVLAGGWKQIPNCEKRSLGKDHTNVGLLLSILAFR
jgi:hypothetical protein